MVRYALGMYQWLDFFVYQEDCVLGQCNYAKTGSTGSSFRHHPEMDRSRTTHSSSYSNYCKFFATVGRR